MRILFVIVCCALTACTAADSGARSRWANPGVAIPFNDRGEGGGNNGGGGMM